MTLASLLAALTFAAGCPVQAFVGGASVCTPDGVLCTADSAPAYYEPSPEGIFLRRSLLVQIGRGNADAFFAYVHEVGHHRTYRLSASTVRRELLAESWAARNYARLARKVFGDRAARQMTERATASGSLR